MLSFFFFFCAISTRHFDFQTFLRLTRLLVDCWWLKKVWCASDFLANCTTCVPLAVPGITRRSSKRVCPGTLYSNLSFPGGLLRSSLVQYSVKVLMCLICLCCSVSVAAAKQAFGPVAAQRCDALRVVHRESCNERGNVLEKTYFF